MSDDKMEIIPKGARPERKARKKSSSVLRLIYAIAIIIVIVWLIGLFLKLAAWLISGLIYVAAIVVIIGIIYQFIKRKQ